MSRPNGLDATEWARAPPSGSGWSRALKAIYNHEDGSFLGRTPKRWGIMLVFYAVFYAVLAVLTSLCFGGLFLTLDEHRPSFTLDKSLIGANPGVAFRPHPRDGDVAVTIDRANSSHQAYYTEMLDEFFQPYESTRWYPSAKGCRANDSYGYPNSACFFVKLNKIFDWQPEYYDDVGSLPGDMPGDLVEHITALGPAQRKQIWVSCAQEKANNTAIEYPWGRGLPGRYYPFRNEMGYLSPLVAVRLIPPANTPIIVRCRVWAKNVIYNKSLKDPSGYTRIQLYIEGNLKDNQTGVIE